MWIVEHSLASVETARAYQLDDVLLMRIAGTKPTACHVVSLEQSLLDVEPPSFTARWHLPPNVRCAAGTAPYEHQQAFRVGVLRPEVVLHAAGGQQTVTVEDLTPRQATEGAVRSLPQQPLDLGGEPVESVGYSRAYDLAEALRDALSSLPAQHPDIPDWLSTYEVVSIGVQRGGIGGFDHLVVRVRG
jgi:hypothetical protein